MQKLLKEPESIRNISCRFATQQVEERPAESLAEHSYEEL
jgi:hypothetical protein